MDGGREGGVAVWREEGVVAVWREGVYIPQLLYVVHSFEHVSLTFTVVRECTCMKML